MMSQIIQYKVKAHIYITSKHCYTTGLQGYFGVKTSSGKCWEIKFLYNGSYRDPELKSQIFKD